MAGIVLLAACATNPATGKRQFSLLNEQQEIALGVQSHQEVLKEMGLYDDRALQEYVTGVGVRLASVSERPTLPWHFAVVDAQAINAFALPGGYIYTTRGIMPFLQNEAELAGVLGHEIGHVTARHSATQYSRATGAQLGLVLGSIFVPATRPYSNLAATGLGVLFLRYGRDDELQADELGVRYTSRAGWNPTGVSGMLSTLDRLQEGESTRGVPNWLSTHPAPADRVEKLAEALRQQAPGSVAPAPTEADRDAYMRRIDGLMYGDNPDQGLVRGHQFLHRSLRFALDFPAGWEVQNGATQVVAKAPDANVYILMQLVQKPAGRNIEEVAVNAMQQAGFQAWSGSRTRMNGLDAFIGTYQGQMQDLGDVGVRAAHVVHGQNAFMIAGLAPVDQYRAVESTFDTSVRSFRPLSEAQAESIRPNRVKLYVARPGDTWQGLAETNGGAVKAHTLAAMNGRPVTQQPRAGERLKIVVAG